MDKKRIFCVIAGIFLIVAGVIIFFTEMAGEEMIMKIAGGCIAVAGLAFLAESFKKKEQ